jgi:hypothetical protein
MWPIYNTHRTLSNTFFKKSLKLFQPRVIFNDGSGFRRAFQDKGGLEHFGGGDKFVKNLLRDSILVPDNGPRPPKARAE